MNKSIATEKEKIDSDLQVLMERHVDSVLDEDGLTVFDFAELRDAFAEYHIRALDHIASVARQEGREEAIEEAYSKLKEINTICPWGVEHRTRIFENDFKAKLTGKEEKV